jgi:high-affinity iron transporter
VLGILAAVAIGIGIYTGGVRINLGKFLSGTSVFLIFVAAGLVLSALRTAHEAGWILIGQGHTVDLSWLAPNGSIRAALITGVLGMPADPRVVELLGWALYLIPMLLWTFWPKRHRPAGRQALRLHAVLGGALVAAAIVLAVGVRPSAVAVPRSAGLADGGTATITTAAKTASLEVVRNGRSQTLRLTDPQSTDENGADTRWRLADRSTPNDRPDEIDVTALQKLNGGRLPVGLDPHSAPGPYAARWTQHRDLTVATRNGGLVAAHQTGKTIVTLTGGGLTSPRTITVTDTRAVTPWQLSDSYRSTVDSTIAAADAANHNLLLWRLWLPVVLAASGIVALGRGIRSWRRLIAVERKNGSTERATKQAVATASAGQHT